MIPQKKIDEAATNATENRFDIKGLIAYGDIYEQGFKRGVQFALDEIQPLMVEFVEEIVGDGWILRSDGWQNVMDYKISEFERRTTDQLLEEFIKSKNEQL